MSAPKPSRPLPADVLSNPAACARLTDSEWVALHAPRFRQVAPAYALFASALAQILELAVRRIAPEALVQTRPKSLSGFAEKILRKRHDYQNPRDPLPPDPLVRVTDLCAGRVITQTAAELKLFGRFIESAFDIDWVNTEDVSRRLKLAEFGYRSFHYVVQINPERLRAAGIRLDLPPELMGFGPAQVGAAAAGRPLKAEIQVRTMLEHAAAVLGHDVLYKTELRVPDRLKRDYATLAATLEGADAGFGQLLDAMAEYRSSDGAHHPRQVVEQEIDRLRLVLACEPGDLPVSLRIAQLALSVGHHETAVEVLRPHAQSDHLGLKRTLGQALTEMHWEEPGGTPYREGQGLLEAAASGPVPDPEALCLLAECVARVDDGRARDLFHQGIQADATEPSILARYLEFEIAHLSNDNAVRLAAPMIRNGMDRCRLQIQGGVNIPLAWSSLTVFHLLVGEPYEALNAVLWLGNLCERPEPAIASTAAAGGRGARPCACGRSLLRLRSTLRRLGCIREKLRGLDWCERALLLCLTVRTGDPEARQGLGQAASWNGRPEPPHFSPADSILILAGGCSLEVQAAMDLLKPALLRGGEGLAFKLISGGTRAGISGVAGDLAEASGGRVVGFGYLPNNGSRRASRAEEDTAPARFARLFYSPGDDFTPLDPLQAWTDLIVAGVAPGRVKLLAYAGGAIATSECCLALALGAQVGVIEHRLVPLERRFNTPGWQDHGHLLRLPLDAMTLRAFLLVDDLPLTGEQQQGLEKAARMAHEDYVRSAAPREPSLQPWERLDPALRLSNFHQVAYWMHLLGQYGLRVRPMTDQDKAHPPLRMEEVVGEEGLRLMAEMEHGRWNVERLLRGWRHAETKDVTNKLSPCLVAWPELTDICGQDYQQFDVNAIRSLPLKLREAGLELEQR